MTTAWIRTLCEWKINVITWWSTKTREASRGHLALHGKGNLKVPRPRRNHRRSAHLLVLGRWTRRWINHNVNCVMHCQCDDWPAVTFPAYASNNLYVTEPRGSRTRHLIVTSWPHIAFSALGVFHVMRYINVRYLLTYLLTHLLIASSAPYQYSDMTIFRHAPQDLDIWVPIIKLVNHLHSTNHIVISMRVNIMHNDDSVHYTASYIFYARSIRLFLYNLLTPAVECSHAIQINHSSRCHACAVNSMQTPRMHATNCPQRRRLQRYVIVTLMTFDKLSNDRRVEVQWKSNRGCNHRITDVWHGDNANCKRRKAIQASTGGGV